MLSVQEVSGLDLAFGGNTNKLLPQYSEIPEEFKNGNTKWNKVFNDWFFNGLHHAEWNPKDGIITTDALRHIKAVMGSYEPKHEHKEAGCAYLMSEFFKDVTYD